MSGPVVIIGAGAAGLVAAWFAAAGAREVILLERTPNGARKILISGGGRCNILPQKLEPDRFVTTSSMNSLRKMLTSWPLDEQRAFFEHEIGILLNLEEESGKYFPQSNSAREVREKLLDAVALRGVDVRMEARVEELDHDGLDFRIRVAGTRPISAETVVLATGGLSVPGTGSDGIGFRLAREFGHTILDTGPALTPLLTEDEELRELSGISLDVDLRCGRGRSALHTRGGFLFTHKGFSGPAVLDLSHLIVHDPATPLHVNWVRTEHDALDRRLQEGGATRVRAAVRGDLPDRLVEVLIRRAGVNGECPLAELPRDDRRRLVQTLTDFALPVSGHENYTKAEVTSGGVPLAEVHPRTMESRQMRGLYLCGEMLDAFGPIGGHNFAWAWATGRLAGRAIAG